RGRRAHRLPRERRRVLRHRRVLVHRRRRAPLGRQLDHPRRHAAASAAARRGAHRGLRVTPDTSNDRPDGPACAAGTPTFIITFRQWLDDYCLGDDPTFGLALVPFCFLSMMLFTRHPTKTNFIFDEQEALLANPYVRSIADAQPKFRWI